VLVQRGSDHSFHCFDKVSPRVDSPGLIKADRFKGSVKHGVKGCGIGLDAQPKISFAPEGLIYEIDAPLSVVAAGLTAPPAPLALADEVIE